MKATSMSPRSGQQAASSRAVVFLHGHQLERNLARAVTAEAAGTFVLVLAITSAAVAAALSRPVEFGAGSYSTNAKRSVGTCATAGPGTHRPQAAVSTTSTLSYPVPARLAARPHGTLLLLHVLLRTRNAKGPPPAGTGP
jgi:hypothetical protein